MPARAVIYCRISKDAEGSRLGVDRQDTECRALAGRLGLEVVDVLVDNDISAYSGKRRPAYETLLDSLRTGAVDAVVAWHPDRLHRSPTELERFIDVVETAHARVSTVEGGEYDLSTSSGRMTARVVGAVARHESEHKAERLRSKVRQMVRDGDPPGGRAPYGYSRSAGSYLIDDVEAEHLLWMADRALEGQSLLWIARALAERGVPTRESGRPWSHGSVRRVLVNPAITGLRSHHGEIAGPGNWPPIIERTTWEALQAAMTDPRRKRRRPNSAYPLSGVLMNPDGVRLIGRRTPSGNHMRRNYVTPVWSAPFVQIGADEIEELTTELVLQRYDKVALPRPVERGESPDIAAVEAELAAWADLRGRGEISLAEYTAGRAPMVERLKAVKADAATTVPPAEPLLEQPGLLRREWKGLGDDGHRRIFARVLESVVVHPVGRGGRWVPIGDRVDPPKWRLPAT